MIGFSMFLYLRWLDWLASQARAWRPDWPRSR
jgi:hypothetical protein